MVIKKSVRTRYRYIKFLYLSEQRTDARQLEAEIRAFVLKQLGCLGNPTLKLLSFTKEGAGILRCSADAFMRVRQALLFFYGTNFRIKLVGSSGTLKALNS